MSFKPKTFLVILELNNVLFYLNNPRIRAVDSHVNRIQVNYHDNYRNLDVSYRRSKM